MTDGCQVLVAAESGRTIAGASVEVHLPREKIALFPLQPDLVDHGGKCERVERAERTRKWRQSAMREVDPTDLVDPADLVDQEAPAVGGALAVSEESPSADEKKSPNQFRSMNG
ncbi:unnamed protein product [Arabis nemorensis]|uniref:Uncharacterized protein n=1 Tax=Arabis nemorensis TaxID=586526 RepID=A0A565BCL3_9BRAS|nr:unnamed protein product [Arabis nemorensis]